MFLPHEIRRRKIKNGSRARTMGGVVDTVPEQGCSDSAMRPEKNGAYQEMPECGGRPNTLFFSEDGLCHVERCLVTGENHCATHCASECGEEEGERGHGLSGIFVCM